MQLAREWLGRSGWHSMAIKIPVSRKGKGDVKGNRLYETINIPDGVDERSAEQLMKGNTKNNFFIYLVNYVLRDLPVRPTRAMTKITKAIPFITGTDLPFEEAQESDYKYSTMEYQKKLQGFLDEIKKTKLIEDESQFGLLTKTTKETYSRNTDAEGNRIVSGQTSSYAVNTDNPEYWSTPRALTLSPHSLSNVKQPTELTIGQIVDVKDLGQITGSKYTIGNSEIAENQDISRRQFLMHFFDTAQPYIEVDKLRKYVTVERKTTETEAEGTDYEDYDPETDEKKIISRTTYTLTIDTYGYFREVFDNHDFGLLKKHGESGFEDLDLTDFQDTKANREKYGKKYESPSVAAEKAHKEILGFLNVIYLEPDEQSIEMKIPGLEASCDKSRRKVTTIGMFKDKGDIGDVEYEFSNPKTGEGGDIQELHAHFKSLNENEMKTKLLENLRVTKDSKDITDIAGHSLSVTKVDDLAALLRPTDKALTLGTLTIVFSKIDKLNNRDMDDFEHFRNIIETGAVSDKVVGEKGLAAYREASAAEDREEKTKEIKELLNDIESNYEDYAHPEMFYEEIIERGYVEEDTPDEIIERVNDALEEEGMGQFSSMEDAMSHMTAEGETIEEEEEDEDEAEAAAESLHRIRERRKKLEEKEGDIGHITEGNSKENIDEAEGKPYLEFDTMKEEQFSDWITNYPNGKTEEDITPEEYKRKIDIIIERFWEENKNYLHLNPTSVKYQNVHNISLIEIKEGTFQPLVKVETAPSSKERKKQSKQSGSGRGTRGKISPQEKLQGTYLNIQRAFESLQGQVNNIGG